MTRPRVRSSDERVADYARQVRRREETRDDSLVRNSRARFDRAALGLELLMMRAIPGNALTDDDIACWMGITAAAVSAEVRKALRHANNVIRFKDQGKLLRELRG